jgi:hypothetical protein
MNIKLNVLGSKINHFYGAPEIQSWLKKIFQFFEASIEMLTQQIYRNRQKKQLLYKSPVFLSIQREVVDIRKPGSSLVTYSKPY